MLAFFLTDASALNAWGNDKSFETFFVRQIETMGESGDVLMVISTSGNSANLVAVSQKARTMGIKVFGLLERDGGNLYRLDFVMKQS